MRRENMRALAVERQGVDAGDGRDGQNVIEMGEERAAAGRLPFERFAERIRPLGWHIEYLVHVHEFDDLETLDDARRLVDLVVAA
jgi:predicted TIM-barrel fold metal-dependent hydrolase